MPRPLLQDMVDDILFDALPVNWTSFDLATFSKTKQLWGYQQEAVENAIKVLWKYYEDFADYQTGEGLEVNDARKEKFFEWYRDNGLTDDLDIGVNKANRSISSLLMDYYETENGKVPYEPFINRISFWMATGSGKTLVIVKLIQALRDLIQRGEIPPYDILVLTHRDDLIEQLKAHVSEFNAAQSDLFIKLRELREYAEAKRDNPSLFKERELTVFYYRSDNLSDEQKEKIIDFRNYDDNGKWYVLLDEAHKGDKEDSKRQHIYSILSRNGFLFNFSATFTDPRDILTTAYDFNLARFIEAGYGKHIAILKQEIRAFKDDDDYNNEEKQKVVLKSLIMLAYVRKSYEVIRGVVEANGNLPLYHKPLLLVLVNSVNTEDADLKLFFRELERIGKAEISDAAWQQAKEELWSELKERPRFMFEEGSNIEIDQQAFESLSQRDILEWVYNSNSHGDIEILVRPSNRQELAFKLKTSDRPFALIKIGDISGWLKEELAGYEVNERFEDEGYFERLNADDSDINILMGSRAFYEGWDSNRPNVINFINIGTGTDAKKFILQSVGRGVRIEPLKNQRKRLLPLYNAKEVEESLFHAIVGAGFTPAHLPIETLFIFGTNRNALQTVIEHLNQEKAKEGEQQLSLFVNEEVKSHKLLIPTYKQAEQPLLEQQKLTKFEITHDELDLLKRYVDFLGDDRVLLALYETEPKQIGILRKSLSRSGDYYKHDGRSYKNLNLLVRRILDYFSVIPEEFKELKKLEEEIRHFKHIKVSLKDICDLQGKVERVKNYPTEIKELRALYGTIPPEEYDRRRREISENEEFDSNGQRINIEYVTNHYYVPMILSEEAKIDYINHIIKTSSEAKFINKLEEYLRREDNKFKEFEWWLFSKLDESLDEVHIPYYNPQINDISHFKPDFIFWLQKGDDYFIVFIDPKGIEHRDPDRKIEGYKQIFEDDSGCPNPFPHDGLQVKVFCSLWTSDVNKLPDGYREYWFDSFEQWLLQLGEPLTKPTTGSV